VQVDVVGADGFADVRADWGRLARLDPRATPFLSAEWAAAWLADWEPRGDVWIMRVADAGEVRGLVPLVVHRRSGARVLGMLGKEPGDYWDVVASEADRPAVATAAALELGRRRSGWDLGILNCLEPDSPTPGALAAGGLRLLHRRAVPSPRIALPASFDAYLASLPAKHRSNLRKHLRKLDGGEVRRRIVTAPDDIRSTMAGWRELRRRRWNAATRDINPEHEQDSFNRFMTEVACTMVPAGTATLWEFQHEDAVAGVYLNFQDERAFYWYLGGFDPDLARLGVGKIAIAAGIRESIDAGRATFDFTRGPDRYKYWYGAVDEPLQSLVVGHDGLRSRAAVAGARVLLARRERN
jgi:CelD/BcsL family acetyltransferase involved in cellulose biosynthesis